MISLKFGCRVFGSAEGVFGEDFNEWVIIGQLYLEKNYYYG